MQVFVGFLIFFLLFQSVLFAVHFYFYKRILTHTELSPSKKRFAKISLYILGLSIPLSLLLGRILPFEFGQVLFWLPMVWLGTMTYPFLIFLFFDLLALVPKTAKEIENPERRMLFRRLAAGSAGIAATGTAGMAIYKNASPPKVYTIPVEIHNLPPAFENFRIVQISDIHIGRPMTGAWLQKVVEQVTALKPDLVALTGDFVDGSVKNLKSSVAPIAGLKSTYGSFFVTGNHEYYSGVEDWLPVFEEFGLKILRNQHTWIQKAGSQICLAGVDDFKAKGKAPGHGPNCAQAFAGVPQEAIKILLAHQPKEIYNAAKQAVDLQLSGHTHGGQLWPWGYVVDWVQPYNIGLYKHNERTQIYVNQGTGAWGPPMRLGTDNEITEIILKLRVPST